MVSNPPGQETWVQSLVRKILWRQKRQPTFSILAWEIAWAEGWRTTVLEVARVRHDLVTRQHFPSLEYPKLELFITKFLISPGPILPKGTVTMHNNKNLAQSLVDRWEVREGREGRELKPSAVVISRMGTVM